MRFREAKALTNTPSVADYFVEFGKLISTRINSNGTLISMLFEKVIAHVSLTKLMMLFGKFGLTLYYNVEFIFSTIIWKFGMWSQAHFWHRTL